MAGDDDARAAQERGQPNSSNTYWQSVRSSASYVVPPTVGAVDNAVKGVYNAFYQKIGSWMPDPQSSETVHGASLSAADEAAAEEKVQPNTSNTYWQSVRSSASYVVPATVGALGNAAKGAYNASYHKIGPWMPSPQFRETARRASLSAASVALEEASGWVPGGRMAWRMAKAGSSEFTKAYGEGAEGKRTKEEAVERKLREMERALDDLKMQNRVPMEKVEMEVRPRAESVGHSNSKPEDVIRDFVAGGFKGRAFLDTLLVPGVGGRSQEMPGTEKK